MACYVVTGANRGIGLALCRMLKRQGDEVIAACRKISDELGALNVRVEAGVDVADDAAVQRFAQRLGTTPVDVLIHNAGVLERVSLDELDLDGIRRQFEINALGPLRVTRALLGNLSGGSKIAIIPSLMGSIADNRSGGHYGYRMSKAAVNMAGMSLAHDLYNRNIAVAILHPGMVQTDMTGHNGIPVDVAARGLLDRIGELSLSNTGTFWHAQGNTLPW